MTLGEYLAAATRQLQAISGTPRLDAELLLAKVINQQRSYLYTWPENRLTDGQCQLYAELLERRKSGEPIAYILAEKEFWSLKLQVNRHTLIPRPETELLVELIVERFSAERVLTVADLGTGCGAIALAIAKERPNWQIFATDISSKALQLATINAKAHGISNIKFCQGDWYSALATDKFDIIVSNPPYIAASEIGLTKGIAFEPKVALFAENNGLAAIMTIIKGAKAKLRRGGQLFLEHGFQQGEAVAKLLVASGYQIMTARSDPTCSPIRANLAVACYQE